MSKKITEYGKCCGKNADFIRCDLLELYRDIGERAIIITCKYIYTQNSKYTTFGNIRVFDEIEEKKTKYQLTDHVNFPKALIERYISLSVEFNHLKFFAICSPEKYNHYDVIRGGLKLLIDCGIPPIARAPEKQWLWEDILNRLITARDCYNVDK